MCDKKQFVTFGQISENLWRVGLGDEGGVTFTDKDEAVRKYKMARYMAKENYVTIEMVNRF